MTQPHSTDEPPLRPDQYHQGECDPTPGECTHPEHPAAAPEDHEAEMLGAAFAAGVYAEREDIEPVPARKNPLVVQDPGEVMPKLPDHITFNYKLNAVARTVVRWLSSFLLIIGVSLVAALGVGDGDITGGAWRVFWGLETAGVVLTVLSSVEMFFGRRAQARWERARSKIDAYPPLVEYVVLVCAWAQTSAAHDVFDVPEPMPSGWIIRTRRVQSTQVAELFAQWHGALTAFSHALAAHRAGPVGRDADDTRGELLAASGHLDAAGARLAEQCHKETSPSG